MSNYNYRKDIRNDEEFAVHIKKTTSIEKQAAEMLVDILREKYPEINLKDNGCDNSGRVVYGKVKATSDFILENYRGKDVKLEKKVSSYPCVTLKEDQIPSFRNNKELVSWVVNWGKPNVKFYLMDAATSIEIFQTYGHYKRHKGFGGKFGWRLFENDLDELTKKYKIKILKPLQS